MEVAIFAATHALAIEYANAFTERYGFGYSDADGEIWAIGFAKFWREAA